MMQQQQLKSSDYRSSASESQQSVDYSMNVKTPSLKASLNALIYKSAKLQSRNCCSNICQIITPVICLLFTIFCRIIAEGITTGAIRSYGYPQPFNFPALNLALRTELNLSCTENYYYQTDYSSQQISSTHMRMQLKDYCGGDKLLNPIFHRKNELNTAVMQQLKEADVTAFERGDDLRTEIPDGLVNFKNSSKNRLEATLSINDYRLAQYHKNNGVTKILIKTSTKSVIGTYLRVTEGLMSLIDKITRPYLQTLSHSSDAEQIIAGSYMYMPFSGQDRSLIDKVVNVVGSGLYPLGLSLLMPIFLYMVVSEKEEKQIQIMKMNGLDSKHYWINFFVVNFILTMLTSLNMYIFGAYIFDIAFFAQTSGIIIWIIFIGWAIAQIALTSFVQIFISNSKTATIVGYLLSIFSTIFGQVISTFIYPLPMTFPLPLLLFPPFALCRIIFYMGWACSDTTGCIRSFSGINSEMWHAIVILYCWFLVYLLSIWLNEIVQQQYGVARNPYLIEKCLRICRKDKNNAQILLQEIETQLGRTSNDANQIEMNNMQYYFLDRKDQLIDSSVQAHKETVMKGSLQGALVIRQISKKYSIDNGEKDKIALKPLTMKLIKGEIFGFLGPNGAGKTTLISVLTGMYPQTSGNAWIQGLEIGHPQTNQLIGVCPQFDILWTSLTVEEHIRFYCKLKQVKEEEIDQRVEQLLKEVDLNDQKSYHIRELSGGMQRRVSIACALSGDPSVVILDEPTSGLDPYHRRQIWKILQRCKKKTSIFMTSHLMDQVEYLCDRIGIISQGQMRCIGELASLKQKFGKGYRLTISYPTMLRDQLCKCPPIVGELIEKLKLEVLNQLETRIILKIDKKDMRYCIEKLKADTSLDWCINQPSLYDVFMHFVK